MPNVASRAQVENRLVIDLTQDIIRKFPSESTHTVNRAVWENLTDAEQDRVWVTAEDYGVVLKFS